MYVVIQVNKMLNFAENVVNDQNKTNNSKEDIFIQR